MLRHFSLVSIARHLARLKKLFSRRAQLKLRPRSSSKTKRRNYGGLVHTLSQRSKRNTTIQGTNTLLLHNSIQGVSSVAVLWNVEWVGHGVMLCLETDLDDLHWGDDRDGFGDSGCETSCLFVSFMFSFLASQCSPLSSQTPSLSF